MHENGIVAEVRDRLQEAGLIPPVRALMSAGDDDAVDEDQPWMNKNESVLVEVTGPVTPGLEARLAEVLRGLAYQVRSVHPNHGVTYG